ncbi:pepsin/retropepsin-like aspartic protease family protein [Sphingosinicella terrae]|uniref:pepsin/retropepsin-like aspartic protease family protein n=1 Tax=Sphingosinicella terrae TaxID=2172047 RepID=UPI0013B437E2|nr:pepsin/retropepsin-like aspartic protease family protein [Sphingosinicella terrae]
MRMSLLALAGGFALAAAAPVAGNEFDAIFEAAGRGDLAPMERQAAAATTPEARALLDAALAAARLDPEAASDPALARLAGDDRVPEMRRAALEVLSSVTFLKGDYAAAARFGDSLEQALRAAGETERAEQAARLHGVAALLSGSPPQRVEGSVAVRAIPLHYDRVGLPRVEVVVNGQRQEAVVDTGANLTVLSGETARRMGIAFRDSETRVGNGVDGTVPVRLGIADRFEIAGTTLRNVAILVIDDEQLTFPLPGGYDIRAIVGLPVLRALGRIEIDNDGSFAVGPGGDPAAAGSPLRASGNDLFVDVEIDGRILPLHLDTGANLTGLSARFAAAHPGVVAGLAIEEARLASAGGTRQAQRATWRNPPLRLGGRTLALAELPVTLAAEEPEPRFNGTLGSNALRTFESYAIDFRAMRLELGPDRAPVAVPTPSAS